MKVYVIILLCLCLLYFIFRKEEDIEAFEENIKQIDKNIELINRLNIKRINKIPVYYINMDRDKDRREYMESQLSSHFERYHRISGVNGKKIKNKYHDVIDGVEFYNEFENNSLSEIGCTLSHLLAIKTAYENGDEIACIMEDDVYMNLLNLKDESLDEFVENININWEILKLFHLDSTKLNKDFISIKKHNFHLYKTLTFSTVCYLINRKGMEKMLSIIGHNPFYLMKYMSTTCAADIILYDQVETYDIEPSLVTINNTKLDSTIHSNHTSNHIEMSLKKIEKYKEDILTKCCSFLNIIIYNENENYERLMKKEIETYLKNFKNVIHYFVTYRDQNEFIMIEDNCIYIKGKEGVVPQCLDKTIIAIDYCINQLHIQFDFLVRSNISSVINFNQFPIRLPLTNCYSSSQILRLDLLDIPYGINKENINKLRGLQYASGTNIIMTKDVVKYLLDHIYELDRTIIDDVSIGFLLSKHFKPIQIKQEKKMMINQIDKDAFVTRNKSKNRYDDVSRMMMINNIESETKYIQENITFIILRHMKEQKHKELWFNCYQSVLSFYPSSKIIVIDDNSKITDERDFIIKKECLIHSDFKGAGEFLPYYYFLKYKWSPKMFFLHDSMSIKYPLSIEHFKTDISPLWHFERHEWDNKERILYYIDKLNYAEDVKDLFYSPEKWYGCYGVACIASLSSLQLIESKYNIFSSIIPYVNCREDRMALERIMGLILTKEFGLKSGLFGSVLEKNGEFKNLKDGPVSKLLLGR